MKRILAGPHAVIEALRAAPGQVQVVCLAESMRPASAQRIEELARQGRVAVEPLPKESLDRLAGELTHQGVLAVTGDYPYLDLDGLVGLAAKEPRPLLVALDQVQDPRNLGAVLRSAYAFGAAGVVITKDRAASVTGAVVRASAGASELIKVARVTNLVRSLDRLRDLGYRVLGAAAQGATDIGDIEWPEKTLLVFGGEGRGLRRLTVEHCDDLFAIPLRRSFDSLNVSAAAAIALFAASRRSAGTDAPKP